MLSHVNGLDLGKILAKSSSLMIWLADVNADHVFFNEAWLLFSGTSAEQQYGKQWRQGIHPDDLKKYENGISRAYERKEAFSLTYRLRNEHNEYRWLKDDGSPYFDENNVFKGYIGSCCDITDIIDAHQELSKDHDIIKSMEAAETAATNAKNKYQRLEQLLRDVGDIAAIGHWELNFKTKDLSWSDEVYAIHGVDRDTYTPALETAIEFYHPKDRAVVTQEIEKALENGDGWQFQLRIIRPDGEIRDVISKASLFRDGSGDVISAMGMLQDITDIKKVSDEKSLLSKAVEYTSTGIIISDQDRNVVWANKAFTTLSGYTLDEVKGHRVSKFVQGPDTDPKTIQAIRKNLAAGANVNVEILNYHKNGTSYWNNLFITPVYNHGEITHFIGLQNDITDFKNQKEQLARLQRVEVINELAAGIAHDINNILGVIEGNRELISLLLGDSPVTKYLDAISRAVDRAQQTTSKILRSSKQINSVRETFDVSDVFTEISKTLKEIIPNNIELNISCTEQFFVNLSRNDLEDALTNIIANASNAISHHGHIQVSAQACDLFTPTSSAFVFCEPKQASHYVLISIKDNGLGITKDDIERIFNPFVSLSSKGSGLGLSVVAGFAMREKIGLSIESEDQRGTNMQLWIPLVDVAPEPRPASSVNQMASQNDTHYNLVLIDDESEIIWATEQLLSMRGHTVTIFDDAQSACNYIEQNRDSIDVIVSDEVMPGPTQGHDIYEKFNSSIPVIITSGFIKNMPHNIPSHCHLTKPYKVNELEALIKRLAK
ncbi:PAS domain S-box protein [Pseudoalteromonas sp. SSDWG2]|uniref:hybrid sensor histidine kinase/response regulator n=1 Tax=Pseudoalteromonas sp. SSDWG2 TaxID=3139391 RepID=UPI003BAB4657